MKANIFCNVCKKPLRAVKEWGKNEVDVYVIPCENCAAQQSVQADEGYECHCNAEHAHMTYIPHKEGCPARLRR